MSLSLSYVCLSIQCATSAWLLSEHSLTFSEGEWLTTGECVAVSITSCLHGLLHACPPPLPQSLCQLSSFINVSARKVVQM